jgi:1-deoxy-D-xylulose-5-phosphate reductoisomerase
LSISPAVKSFQWGTLKLEDLGSLEFIKFDKKRFPAFNLAMEAARMGGTATSVLNAADEVAVETFLSGKIEYLTIIDWIEEALSAHHLETISNVDDVFAADRWARDFLASRHNEAILI